MGRANNFRCRWCKTPWEEQRGKGHFCDNSCQGLFTWNILSKPRIKKGLVDSPRLLRRFVVERDGEQCKLCGQGPEWNGKPLVLQLDHKDGDSDNNRPANLRLLCPNCHTQTDTFSCKGVGNKSRKMTARAMKRRKEI